ncbi:MAG: hemolysin III family protein [Clostridium sp.]|nr:hemolysin III family protein [Clostridium sp.]
MHVETNKIRKIKEPGSAITHFIGMFMAAFAAAPLIVKAEAGVGRGRIPAAVIFIVSMILLYGASTSYHTFDISEQVNKILKKLDHAMIFVLIAGTYTPVCVMGLGDRMGYLLLMIIWTIAAMGITFKMLWVTCPKWISSVMYIVMGWLCMAAAPFLIRNLGSGAFAWLLTGGIIYTIGGVIYALKLKGFNERHKRFGTHEIFHLFCLGGSFCHFMLVYLYLV